MRTIRALLFGLLAGIAIAGAIFSTLSAPAPAAPIQPVGLDQWPPAAASAIQALNARVSEHGYTSQLYPMGPPLSTEGGGSVWIVVFRSTNEEETIYVPIAVELDADGAMVGVH